MDTSGSAGDNATALRDGQFDNRIQGLGALLAAQDMSKPPPVDKWDPPYCGDIGMAIESDGTWFYQGSPIGRKPLVQLFARVLRRDADGRHYLVTPVEKVDVKVEDAPFLAVEMEVEGSGRDATVIFRTNVDDIVRCGPDNPLRFEKEPGSGGLKPYVLVRGRLEALVTRAIYYDLVEMAISSQDRPEGVGGDQPGIWSGGKFFALAA
ncbi:MAG: DUF1285 domain-containing protein [Alphaproteobacteria bacterium]|nr:DUF1285 domain-containing protein [Alphaproteobacteria bacterium]